ncbi:MAG: transglutaminase-like domain-containing protein [bacterium]
MEKYLKPSEYIDSNHPAIMEKAAELSGGLGKAEDIARASFEFVRDCVRHSWDYKLNPVTCRASDVLLHGTGYCYSKSHLLAALLRANKIPAGLCYQRLPKETEGPPFCLHGLNAVFIKPYGWYRIDARGNKPGVCADFCPPIEELAFPVLTGSGECDVPGIFAEPLESVISVLTGYDTVELVYENLPDINING